MGTLEGNQYSDEYLEGLRVLHQYTACDISDALFKLDVNRGGHLVDLYPFAPYASHSKELDTQPKVIAPATTVRFVDKDYEMTQDEADELAIGLSGKHFADIVQRQSVAVISQPPNQKNAVVGGIIASQLKQHGIAGVVVQGRVRDIRELRSLGLPTWAAGTSTQGGGTASKLLSVGKPITLGSDLQGDSADGVVVEQDDIMFCDPMEGVVVIPKQHLDAILKMLPPLIEADERVKMDIQRGVGLKEAFDKHR